MRIIGLLLAMFFLTSCTYKTIHPVRTFWFTFENSSKTELIQTLDAFATTEGFKKKQEGGEYMSTETKNRMIFAVYSNAANYEFQSQNIINEKCFSIATYDKSETGANKAQQISDKLKSFLISHFSTRLAFYNDQYCKIPVSAVGANSEA